MLDIKPYGAFIENTIRPVIEEFKWLLRELEKKGISITKESMTQVIGCLLRAHLAITVIQSLANVIAISIIGFAAYKILR